MAMDGSFSGHTFRKDIAMSPLINLTIREMDVEGKNVGDIIDIDGKKFKILKKTTTTVAVERWYWFDALAVRLLKKKGDE